MSKNFGRRFETLAGLAIAAAATPVTAEDFIWQPQCDTIWQTCCGGDVTKVNNWGRSSPAPICPAQPTAADDVTIAGDCTVGTTPPASALTIDQGGGTFTVAGPLTIADAAIFDGPLVWTAGEIARAGGAGTQYAQANAGLSIEGDADRTLSFFGGFRLINAGIGSWTGNGTLTVGMIPGGCCPAIFENAEGATFHVLSDAAIIQTAFGVGSIENYGTLTKSGTSGTSDWAVNLYNDGLVHVQDGELKLTRAGNATGVFQVDAGATLRFAGGGFELLPGCDIVGEGLAIVSGSNTGDGIVVNEPLTLGRLTVADDGRVGGTGNLGVTDLLDVQGGDISLYTTVMDGAEMRVSGVAQFLGKIDVDGTLRIVSGALAGCFNQILTIQEDGVLEVEPGATFGQTGLVTQPIENHGTIQKGPGSGVANVYNAFNTPVNCRPTGRIVCNDGELFIQNNLNLEGRIEVAQGASVKLKGWANYYDGAEVVGDGELHLFEAGNNYIDAAAEFEVDNLRISGVYFAGHGITGEGTLRIRRSLEWTGGGVWSAVTIVDPGAIVRATGDTYHSCDTTWQNSGTFENISGGAEYRQFNNLQGGVVDLQSEAYFGGEFGSRPMDNAGLLKKTAGTGDSIVGSHVTSSGFIESYSGRLGVLSLIQSAGATRLVGGAFIANQGYTLNGGTLEGVGTATATITNNGGAVAPGNDGPGALTIGANASPFIAGNYTQGVNGSLRIEIGGPAAGQFDTLTVAGTAALGGGVNVALIDGYIPPIGAEFVVLTAASRTGTFARMSGAQIAPGKKWEVAYTANSAVLRVVKGGTFPGDLDGDNDCRLDDLSRLLTAYGTCDGQPGFDPASDLDGSGCVDLGDLLMLLDSFGI